ncbi:hypothetical protein D3C86_1266780 [compost metagenome]
MLLGKTYICLETLIASFALSLQPERLGGLRIAKVPKPRRILGPFPVLQEPGDNLEAGRRAPGGMLPVVRGQQQRLIPVAPAVAAVIPMLAERARQTVEPVVSGAPFPHILTVPAAVRAIRAVLEIMGTEVMGCLVAMVRAVSSLFIQKTLSIMESSLRMGRPVVTDTGLVVAVPVVVTLRLQRQRLPQK